MKKILILSLVLSTALSFGQKKKTLGLLTFKAPSLEYYAEAELLTETVKELFVESKRFRPLDRSLYTQTAVFKEKDIQKNIDFINGYVIKQGKQNGAKFLVGGSLSSVEYKEKESGVIRCLLSFSINITDIETGELIDSETFTPSIISESGGIDNSTALASEIKSKRNKIRNFIISNAPFDINIFQVEKTKKGGKIVLEYGNEDGAKKGNRFAIYKITKYGKKTLKEEITKFSIKEVQGDFSIGMIKKNDLNILLELFENSKEKLSCEAVACKICPGPIPFIND